MKAQKIINRIKRILFPTIMGGGLIWGGFKLDGITEVGHHAMLIVGGVIVGAFLMLEVMTDEC